MEILAQEGIAPGQGLTYGQGPATSPRAGGFQLLLDPPDATGQGGDGMVLDGAASVRPGDCQVDRGDLMEALVAAGYSRGDAQAALDLAATPGGGVDPQKLEHYLGLATRREAPSPLPPTWYAG